MIFARKISKIHEFYTTFARKMPKFYIIIDRKIFFLNAPHATHVFYEYETDRQTKSQTDTTENNTIIATLCHVGGNYIESFKRLHNRHRC